MRTRRLREVVLAADALLGLILLAVAFGGRLLAAWPSSPAGAAPQQTARVEIATRFGGLQAQAGKADLAAAGRNHLAGHR